MQPLVNMKITIKLYQFYFYLILAGFNLKWQEKTKCVSQDI